VRERVRQNSGIELHWEIKRLGIEQSEIELGVGQS